MYVGQYRLNGCQHLPYGQASGCLAFWMQTTGTLLLVISRSSLACVRTAAQGGRSAPGLLYSSAVRLSCWPRRLGLRGLPQREPAIPVAYCLAQLRLLNTELILAGSPALQAFVPVTASLLYPPKVLRRWIVHDGLLICAVGSDGAVMLVLLMISPQYSHRLHLETVPNDAHAPQSS